MIKHFRPLLLAATLGLMSSLGSAHAQTSDSTPTSKVRILNQENFHNVINDVPPVILLITNKACTNCPAAELKFAELSARYPTVRFAMVDFTLMAGAPLRKDQIDRLPALQTSMQGQPILYVHNSVDKLPGGSAAVIEARIAALQKLQPLAAELSDMDALIAENRHAYGKYDGLRKPSDRPERERLDRELASFYERKGALIRLMSPLVEDENDAGPAS